MNREDLKNLAHERLVDARALLAAKRYSAAYYLCGYVVECGLKACIAKRTQRFDFPPEPNIIRRIYVHDLAVLLRSAELEQALEMDMKTDDELRGNWALAGDWAEDSRYQTWTEADAQSLFEAVADEKHGVLQWISQHW